MPIEVEINGEKRSVREDATIAALLGELGITSATNTAATNSVERIAVEHNGHIVRRAELATTGLAGGDRIEIVTLVGGG